MDHVVIAHQEGPNRGTVGLRFNHGVLARVMLWHSGRGLYSVHVIVSRDCEEVRVSRSEHVEGEAARVAADAVLGLVREFAGADAATVAALPVHVYPRPVIRQPRRRGATRALRGAL